jgi:hypothetical protein
LSQEQLTLLIGGIELAKARPKEWYRKEIAEKGIEEAGN